MQTHARLKRQFKSLSKKINRHLDNEEWKDFSIEYRHDLVERLKKLYTRLSSLVNSRRLYKILGASALLLGMTGNSNAQSFAAPQTNPFGITTVGDFSTPILVDIDNDGDLDLFIGDYNQNLSFFENTGDANNPSFAAADTAAFGLDVFPAHITPAFGDLDNDGDVDLIIGFDAPYLPDGHINFYENTGTVSAANFASAVNNPFGFTTTYYYAFPALADIDNDGDLDLFVGEYYGNTVYYENTGTASSPAFAAPVANPFGLIAVNSTAAPTIVDLDLDGDLDFFIGEYGGNFQYFENTGTASSPAFAAPVQNPFGITAVYSDGEIVFPRFGDIDGDGDPDLFVGEYYGTTVYFENTQINTSTDDHTASRFEIYPTVSDGQIKIDMQERGNMHVYDVSGKLLMSRDLNGSTSMQLDLVSGTYIVVMQFDDGMSENHRLIIQ